MIDKSRLAEANAAHEKNLACDYDDLGAHLSRRGIDIDAILKKASEFAVAVPSWGAGTGGTRFARFPGKAEPRNIFEKLEDCAVINQLVRITGEVSPHFPWDVVDDMGDVKAAADSHGLTFGPVNSNTFQDQLGQFHSYKYGSLSHTDKSTREQAVDHNIKCIEWGKAIGSDVLTVWVGDGSNFAGQSNFTRQFERYLASMEDIYKALPNDWRMFIEHKMFEPSFYSTVIQDWGSNILAAQHLGEKCFSLVDLGHHAPNVNIEMIVARLIQFEKLAGFHFNDSKYGDDDLDSGSLHPFQQFLIFNELIDAEHSGANNFRPEYMLDQSHNMTDPIESLATSAVAVQRSYVQALLINRTELEGYQNENDAMMASQCLKTAYQTDVTPILTMARFKAGGAIDPVGFYRSLDYRENLEAKRPASANPSSGIV
jgi:L-rhamnose isomerase/sugar isomerase